MKEIIKIHNEIQIGSEVVKAVNSKELYLKLTEGNSQTNFSRWIERNLINNSFMVENRDYIVFSQWAKTPAEGVFFHRNKTSNTGGRPGKYDNLYITIDTAKHLCMLTDCKNGHTIREYFIECEKELRKVQQQRLPQTYREALAELLREVEEKEKLAAQIEEDKPKVEFANQVAISDDCIAIGDFAKILTDNKTIKIGRNKLFKWFRDNKYLMSDNMPYQQYIDLDYFRVIEQTYEVNDEVKIGTKTLLTGKGQLYFTEKLKKSK